VAFTEQFFTKLPVDKEIIVNMCTRFRPNWIIFRKKKPNLMLRLNYSTAFTESILSKLRNTE